jgi:hypothetical protein
MAKDHFQSLLLILADKRFYLFFQAYMFGKYIIFVVLKQPNKMTFEIVPILQKMKELYEKPANFNRFREYLQLLIGGSDNDLETPIGGFNPMAKAHILEKLNELIALDAEQIAQETLVEINQLQSKDGIQYKVFLNLSDDLKGGWTNHYTSDYDSKFKINGIFRRKFCTPILWTSESYSSALIRNRVAEYVYRSIYWTKKPNPKTLKEHLEQEIFVANCVKDKDIPREFDSKSAKDFYLTHQDSDNYNLIFNFFYGDRASESLGFATFGTEENMTGFEYARVLIR